MAGKYKTKEELMEEIRLLKERIAELEKYESERNELDDKFIRRSVELASINADLEDEIEKRKVTEEALRESGRKIRALYDQTFQFIGLMTPDGTLIEANRTALDFIGSKLEDVLNKPFWLTPWWAHSPELQEKLRQAIKKVAQGEFLRFEVTHMAKDGSLHEIDFSLKPVKDENGKVVFMIPEGRDVTDSRKAERALREAHTKLKGIQDQLIQAEKMNAIGQLASGVAHEVRNPLGIILQGVNYLENKLSDKEGDVLETLTMLKDSINRADNIINSLLDFSKIGSLSLKSADIKSILETSLILVKNRLKFENIDIIIEIKKDLPEVLADKNRLEEVFINILLNAVQAMPKGGKIFIRGFEKKLEQIRNGIGRRAQDIFHLGEEVLVVEVEDTGPGISEENMNRIFDPFFTTKGQRGTGLGLYVSRSIINLHKGLIYAESKFGQGTKITVLFKIVRNAIK